MTKIKLTDTMPDIIMSMSEGNPGAIRVLMELLEHTNRIDPQNMMGGLGTILSLDTHEIYGSSIWIIYSDKCGKDIRRMIMLLRATQLGFFTEGKLQQMAADQMGEINLTEEEFKAIDDKVCAGLEQFERPSN